MNASDMISELKKNPFVLAPMAGITDRPFRSFMREMGCGCVITELVSATGLRYSPNKTRRLMEFSSDQSPIGIQFFGDNLEHLADAAKVAEEMGADFVDLNFGCPVPKVVNRGAGSACLRDLPTMAKMIRSVKSATGLPVTIKIRTGWDQNTRNSHEVVQLAANEGVSWVAIHGRTRAQGYSGLSDWDYIAEVKAKSPIPVLGNGDVQSGEQARERLRASGCDGVMIGRGCLRNPFIFREAQGVSEREPLTEVLWRLCSHLESFYDERLTLIQMRKFSSWFSAGFPGAAQFRRDLFHTDGREPLMALIHDFFMAQTNETVREIGSEPFLMGGHG